LSPKGEPRQSRKAEAGSDQHIQLLLDRQFGEEPARNAFA